MHQSKSQFTDKRYPREGYVQPKGIPPFNDPEFLGDKAWDWAIYICDPRFNKYRNKWEAGNNLTTHQVRRYYGEFKTIERSLPFEGNEENWNGTYSQIKLILAKAVYDSNRSTSNLPFKFKEFIENVIRVIPSEYTKGTSAFKKMCLFFEAVVGYSSEYTKK